MTNRFSRRAIARALLATTALVASPALAVAPSGTPPVHQNVDSNGVDMALGTFTFSTPALSIGPAAPHGLSYDRENLGNGWRENVAATIARDASGYIIVSAGGTSDRFQDLGSSFSNTEGDGATLTFNGAVYIYTNRNGTVAQFDEANGDYDRYVADIGWIRDVTFPNGVKWTYQYLGQNYCPTNPDPGDPCYLPEARSVRLEAVFSNTGYQLLFGYQSDTLNVLDDLDAWQTLVSVKAINNSTDYCNPVTGSCSVTHTWPVLTFSRTNTGSGFDDTETDATGAVTHYYSDDGLRLTGIRRPGATSNDVSITYGTDGHVSQLIKAGITYNYSWVDGGNTRTMTRTDPLSHTMTAVSAIDTSLVSSVTDENGKTTNYQYDASFRPTQVTEPEGNYVQYTYDARGNVTQTSRVAKPASGLSNIVTTAGYDATCTNAKTCNQPNWTKDANNNETDYTYDGTHGGVLTITQPAPTTGAVRPQTRYVYSALQAYYKQASGGSPSAGGTIYLPTALSVCQTLSSCAGAADEAKASVSYGPQVAGTANNLLPVTITNASGDGALTATTAFTYDTVGNTLTVDGPLSGTADTAMTRYDADRRVIGQISPDPDGAGALKMRALRTTWNGDGTVSKLERGTVNSQSDSDWNLFATLETIDFTYDGYGRLSTKKLSSSGTAFALTQTSYDSLGRLDCTAVRMNTAVYGSLPSSACTLSTQGSNGPDRVSQNVYDAVGRVTQSKVAVGTSDAAAERTLAYTSNGKVQTLLDGENNLTTYVYDGFDRLSQTQFPSSTKGAGTSNTSDYEQLGYDANSNVTSHRLRDGTSITFSYDNLNRVSLKTLPNSEPFVSYAYDNLGRLTSASQTGNSLSFTYDALNRNLTQVSPQGTVTSTWDLAGRRTQLTYPGSGLYVNYDFLVTGEVSAIRENGATSGVGVLASYGYDNLGNRTSLTFGNGAVQSFGYDPVARLSSLSNDLAGTTNDFSNAFTYNPASQIVSATRSGDTYASNGLSNENTNGTSNGLNQLTAYGAKSLTHDARGNVTAFGTKNFTYSSENLLLTGPNSSTLNYDPLMRLGEVSSAATTRFAYDGLNRIAEYDGSNNLLRRYVHGPGIDEPIVWYEGSGTTNRRFLSADERGSIIAVTDSSGNLLGINRYDEYGRPQSGNLGVWGYTGQAWVPELGEYYYKARFYEPELGRFLQPDPIGPEDDANLYQYSRNDPVQFFDPLGFGDDTPPSELHNTVPYNPGERPIIITGNRPVDVVIEVGSLSVAVPVYGYQLADFLGGLPNYAVSEVKYNEKKVLTIVLRKLGANVKSPTPPKLVFPSYKQIVEAQNEQIRKFYAEQNNNINNWKTKAKAWFEIFNHIMSGMTGTGN
jgi:RHS repeat-associated protein